jgi:hypothetical protein
LAGFVKGVDAGIILYQVGRLKTAKVNEVIDKLVEILHQ